MADKKLESFKIGDTRKPTVASTQKKTATTPEAQSLGFRRIESILESEDQATAIAGLQKILQDLDGLEKSGGNKEKAAAKKAIVAVERTTDLMDFLYQTKATMAGATK